MKIESNDQHIVLIDQQPYWRQIATEALKRVGFTVGVLDTYHYPPPQHDLESGTPDLVVLGCSRIGTEEQQLIEKVLSQKHHLLVLCTSFSWQTVRTLFLQGVDDILDKPYNPMKLVKIVNHTLEATIYSSQHTGAERKGVA
jgi:DNA-binding NtrC family response regulator